MFFRIDVYFFGAFFATNGLAYGDFISFFLAIKGLL